MLFQLFRKNEIKVLLLFIAFVFVCKYFKVNCIVYSITSFPCPTCGMTRALESLFFGDFNAYMNYNVMALPVLTVFLCQLFYKYFGKFKIVLHIFTVVVLIVNLIYYIARIKKLLT